jgi:3-phenylpropionate/cinnamic acid dioxygenase small subunit
MDSYREIENLIYTYAELIDAGDLEGMAELFSHADFFGPDGEIAASGAQEFLTLQRQAVNIYSETGTPRTKHVTTNVIIEVNEPTDMATARSYFTVLQSTEELPLQPIIAGRYEDNFERVGGNWRFSRRQSIPEFYGDLSKHLQFDVNDNGR